MAFRGDAGFHQHVPWSLSNVHPSSYAKVLDEEDQMTDAEVLEFLTIADRKLVDRLGGLPIRSSDIPLSFHGQRTLQRLKQDMQPIPRSQTPPTSTLHNTLSAGSAPVPYIIPSKKMPPQAPDTKDSRQLLLDGVDRSTCTNEGRTIVSSTHTQAAGEGSA